MKEVLLQFENVSYESSNQGQLKDLSFSVSKGENILFFGPENSGLDLLSRVILDFEEDFSGNVLYKSKSIRDFDYIEKHDYKKELGYLHSDYGLISNMSVVKNISLPLEYHSRKSIGEIKKQVDDIVREMRLDKCCELRPVFLTKSEILRTAFARATILDPDIIIVEHAFEGQSPLNIRSILNKLKDRAIEEDKSVIFISYEPEIFTELVDKFVMLFEGEIVFMGGRDDFINSDNEYLFQYKTMSSYGPMSII
ncbi:ATP-binding cassette domain-containing protein [Spirochaetota bacterium]